MLNKSLGRRTDGVADEHARAAAFGAETRITDRVNNVIVSR